MKPQLQQKKERRQIYSLTVPSDETHPIVGTKYSIMTQEARQIGKTRPYLSVSRV